jgi:hypothetical protein
VELHALVVDELHGAGERRLAADGKRSSPDTMRSTRSSGSRSMMPIAASGSSPNSQRAIVIG